MISLSDSELQIVMEAARPIPARDRDAFLRDVAVELGVDVLPPENCRARPLTNARARRDPS